MVIVETVEKMAEDKKPAEYGPTGCSKWPSSKAAGESKLEAYPQGYVKDFDEPRTPLAGFFSILLAGRIMPLGEEGNNIYFHPPLSHRPSQPSHSRTGR